MRPLYRVDTAVIEAENLYARYCNEKGLEQIPGFAIIVDFVDVFCRCDKRAGNC
jgi:hypothetical protein